MCDQRDLCVGDQPRATTCQLTTASHSACLLSSSTMVDNRPINTQQSGGFFTRLKHRLNPQSGSAPPTRPASPHPLASCHETTFGEITSVPQAIVSPVAALIHPGVRPLTSADHTPTHGVGVTIAHSSAQSASRSPAQRGELLLRSHVITLGLMRTGDSCRR
jgi:hypothetical protein